MQQMLQCRCPEKLSDMANYGVHICRDGTRIPPEDFYAEAPSEPSAYDRFIDALWRELKRMAIEPMLSMGELVAVLAWMAYPPPWWFSTPLVLAWLIWRNKRRDSDTRPRAGDAKQGSTRE